MTLLGWPVLKLVIIDQTDYGMIFNDFLHVELCRGRIEEKREWGRRDFKVMKSLLSNLFHYE